MSQNTREFALSDWAIVFLFTSRMFRMNEIDVVWSRSFHSQSIFVGHIYFQVKSSINFLTDHHEFLPLSYKTKGIVFLIIGAANFTGAIVSHGCFSILGEAMTQRLRLAILTSMFRQEVGYHDNPDTWIRLGEVKLLFVKKKRMMRLSSGVFLFDCLATVMI